MKNSKDQKQRQKECTTKTLSAEVKELKSELQLFKRNFVGNRLLVFRKIGVKGEVNINVIVAEKWVFYNAYRLAGEILANIALNVGM